MLRHYLLLITRHGLLYAWLATWSSRRMIGQDTTLATTFRSRTGLIQEGHIWVGHRIQHLCQSLVGGMHLSLCCCR